MPDQQKLTLASHKRLVKTGLQMSKVTFVRVVQLPDFYIYKKLQKSEVKILII